MFASASGVILRINGYYFQKNAPTVQDKQRTCILFKLVEVFRGKNVKYSRRVVMITGKLYRARQKLWTQVLPDRYCVKDSTFRFSHTSRPFG